MTEADFLERIAVELTELNATLSLRLNGMEDRLCEIRDEVNYLAIINEARG
jgi:hypothetical protein